MRLLQDARGPGGLQTAPDWYYGCRYCQHKTSLYCEGTDRLTGNICDVYICGVCAVVQAALHDETQQEACIVLCPTCAPEYPE
jgi:hypothetical protein